MLRNARSRSSMSRWLCLAATLVLLVSLAPPSASASAGSAGPPSGKVEQRLLDQFERRDEVTFWVVLRERADLSRARGIPEWARRGRAVVDTLRETADRSQGGIRGLLRGRRIEHRPFWITNTIRVRGDEALAAELAARREVASVVADRTYDLPEPVPPGKEQVTAVEWNIDRIGAPRVWSTFGSRGEGVVVANIDTGVQFDHPALLAQYRGNLGDGFDHDYNWFDPSQVCGSPSLVPCDNAGHGTHTMGTMVGDDGDPGPNQIGVAPRARWIAAKGCEDFGCSLSALLSSGQWVLAPTRLDGTDPRPDLRPHVVNNSWGGGPGDDFFQATVEAWVAAGIFPQFSNGNSGPDCGTSGSPGDYPAAYSAGAFDIDNAIAGFSSRGPSAFGETKPDIAAPGVDVRSSVPGNAYASFSGTSMAAPHVAGTVALMWSAAPTLAGDVAATRALLDESAVDTADLSCGGSDGDNNVWGQGRLDAFAAVDRSPRGPTGTLTGSVTDAGSGAAVSGATVTATGPAARSTSTRADGTYSMRLPVGTYDITGTAFGYHEQSVAGAEVRENETTQQDLTLTAAPAHPVSGTVRDDNGEPVEDATVRLLGTPVPPATTDASGGFAFAAIPEGEYDVRVDPGPCLQAQTLPLVVDGPQVLDVSAPGKTDGFGHRCRPDAFDYIEGDTVLPLSGDDGAVGVGLPFSFDFYGQSYDTAYVSTNGFLSFTGPSGRYGNGPLPDPGEPNAAVYPLWDDLYVDEAASVRTRLLGAAPDRRFVVEWRNVAFCCISAERLTFEVVLHENGHIVAQYASVDGPREDGSSATIGIENEHGSDALLYSVNTAAVRDGLAVRYTPPPSGRVVGTVTDAVDGDAVAGANVRAVQGGVAIRTATTGADGAYRLNLPLGSYQIEASAARYEPATAQVTLDAEGAVLTRDFALRSARAQVEPPALDFVVPAGTTRTQRLLLSNTGLLDLTYEIGEVRVAPVAAASAAVVDRSSRQAPQGYTAERAPTVHAGGPVLVFMDALPWGSQSLLDVLTVNGISHDVASSADMSSLDLSGYEVVILSNDQPQAFYDRYAASLSRFDGYVRGGGFLWAGAAAWGWNGGDFTGGTLPGGATVRLVIDEFNDVTDPAHPVVQGVPDPFFGTAASHAAFSSLPAGAEVIARSEVTGEPTLVEYDLEAGRVLAFGQTLEFALENGQDAGRILENAVPYAYDFEPFVDVPWLSAAPASGSVRPGATQELRVTVDTTGLEAGLHRARLVLQTNDPRNPRLLVPVTLVVPAYQQAVNAGGDAYTDRAGDPWATDQRYASGGWGYTNASSSTGSTNRGIDGTDDDRLYQSQRVNPLEYRFDGLPDGTYEVDLRFAEVTNRRPNTRLFDVIVEHAVVLPAHDVAAEVGVRVADRHTALAELTDGQLNVRFVGRRGYAMPIVNAVRVTHRPDR